MHGKGKSIKPQRYYYRSAFYDNRRHPFASSWRAELRLLLAGTMPDLLDAVRGGKMTLSELLVAWGIVAAVLVIPIRELIGQYLKCKDSK